MSGSSRYRLLTEEEIDLWRHVAQSVSPRPGSSLPQVTPPEVKKAARPDPAGKSNPPPGHRSMMPSYTPPLSKPRATVPGLPSLDTKYRKKVARGRIGIERAFDLHGLTQAEAHGALRGFLHAAQADDLRLVLIVTGKGRFSADPARDVGILRRAVPHWLREADLRGVVLSFDEASRPHGGSGALYVRLRSKAKR